jgi:hypothetical protein
MNMVLTLLTLAATRERSRELNFFLFILYTDEVTVGRVCHIYTPILSHNKILIRAAKTVRKFLNSTLSLAGALIPALLIAEGFGPPAPAAPGGRFRSGFKIMTFFTTHSGSSPKSKNRVSIPILKNLPRRPFTPKIGVD